MQITAIDRRNTPNLDKKPSSLRYFQEGPAPVDMGQWRLDILGNVTNPLSLDLRELQEMPVQIHHRRTVCVCLWTIKRYWHGVLLGDVLDRAGVDLNDESLFIKQTSIGTDKGKYDATIHMKSAVRRNALLAWGADDQPLTLETGFPLRLIDFGLFQYKCVKALKEIEITRKNELGFWESHSGYDLDGTVQSKKYYAVDLQCKIWFERTGEIMDSDLP